MYRVEGYSNRELAKAERGEGRSAANAKRDAKRVERTARSASVSGQG